MLFFDSLNKDQIFSMLPRAAKQKLIIV
ncbi:hypothetical protein, partial [Acinetobacter baumannii]